MKTWADYILEVQRTANSDADTTQRILTAAAGLSGEVGEVRDTIKKYLGHGHDTAETVALLNKELGDIFWYIAEIGHFFGMRLFRNDVELDLISNMYQYPPARYRSNPVSGDIWKAAYNLSHRASIVDQQIDIYIDSDYEPNVTDLMNVVWSAVSVANLFGLTVREILDENKAKLRKRYPNGFSQEDSINRSEAP